MLLVGALVGIKARAGVEQYLLCFVRRHGRLPNILEVPLGLGIGDVKLDIYGISLHRECRPQRVRVRIGGRRESRGHFLQLPPSQG